jgi:hypothetical protein
VRLQPLGHLSDDIAKVKDFPPCSRTASKDRVQEPRKIGPGVLSLFESGPTHFMGVSVGAQMRASPQFGWCDREVTHNRKRGLQRNRGHKLVSRMKKASRMKKEDRHVRAKRGKILMQF